MYNKDTNNKVNHHIGYSNQDKNFEYLLHGDQLMDHSFLNRIDVQKFNELDYDLQQRFAKFLEAHEDENGLVEQLINLSIDEKNQRLEAISQAFLSDMLENPELHEDISSLTHLISELKERKATVDDKNKCIGLLDALSASVSKIDGEFNKLTQEISQEAGESIKNFIAAKNNTERAASLEEVLKVVKGVSQKQEHLAAESINYRNLNDEALLNRNTNFQSSLESNQGVKSYPQESLNEPLENPDYYDYNSLIASFKNGSSSIGQLMMLLTSFALITRETSIFRMKEMVRTQSLVKDANTYKSFLDELANDMNGSGASVDTHGDLYLFLRNIMQNKDGKYSALKDKYQGFLNTFKVNGIDWSMGPLPKPTVPDDEKHKEEWDKYKQSLKEYLANPVEAKKLATALNNWVSNVNNQLRAVGQDSSILDLFEVNTDPKSGAIGAIVFKCKNDDATKTPDFDTVDTSWFTKSKSHAEKIGQNLNMIETKDKANAEAAQKSMEGANSMMFTFVAAVGQMYRGQ